MPEVRLGFNDKDGIRLDGVQAARSLQKDGPTIEAVVTFYTGKGGEPGASRRVEALIDTGASVSCIDEKLAQELQLPIIRWRPVSGISGSNLAPEHLAQLHVPLLHKTMVGIVAGVKLAEGGQRHKMLLGREFLLQFRMTYEGRSGLVVIEDNSPPLPSYFGDNKILLPAKVGRKSKLPPKRPRMRR